jgi:hypothetical protein
MVYAETRNSSLPLARLGQNFQKDFTKCQKAYKEIKYIKPKEQFSSALLDFLPQAENICQCLDISDCHTGEMLLV